ncbi:MAG TPA: FISUMP domain-containing protein, partial [Candidatus Angelobacter sp.]|nr:FISUMP domain-containing protein [Candidatus Angelobacter sp.]
STSGQDSYYRIITYTLTISAGTGGTVNTAVNGTYNTGSTPTITATANSYYTFASWSGSTGCSGVASHTITMNANKTCTASFVLDSNWLAVGTQVWAKANLNVGTRIAGVTNQTNNAILEKYCYSDTESNCTTYGGLYQWNEAMQYVTTQGAQGICPTGSHIPSDNDWKILEMQLGMSQAQADATSFRGTDQGTQLKSGGASGLNMPLAGHRGVLGPFYNLSYYASLWSSSESSATAWKRYLASALATVDRDPDSKDNGFSVRCLKN